MLEVPGYLFCPDCDQETYKDWGGATWTECTVCGSAERR